MFCQLQHIESLVNSQAKLIPLCIEVMKGSILVCVCNYYVQCSIVADC